MLSQSFPYPTGKETMIARNGGGRTLSSEKQSSLCRSTQPVSNRDEIKTQVWQMCFPVNLCLYFESTTSNRPWLREADESSQAARESTSVLLAISSKQA